MDRYNVCLSLSKTELEQLVYYARVCDDDGTYYGNRDQFEKRHKHLWDELIVALKGLRGE